MQKIRVTIIAIFIASMMLTPAAFAQDGIESVCLVTDIGSVDDGTFNEFAFDGMMLAADEFDLDTTAIETVAPTDYGNNIDTCIQEDFEVIVTVGFLLRDETLRAAAENPDVYFIGVDQNLEEPGVEATANYAGIQFREDQAGFLVGALGALLTESNILGGVYGMEIPPVVKFASGYEQGAGFVANLTDTEIEVKGVYTGSFTEPDIGRSTANQLIGDGADVIFGAGGQTGSGGLQEGAEQGIYVIGVDQDEYFTTFGEGETPGAEYLVSSAVKRVDQGVYQLVAILAEGNMDDFPGGVNYILSIENEGITFAPKNDAEVDDAYYEFVTEIQTMLASGELDTGVNPATGELETPIAEIMADMEFDLEVPE